MVPKVGFAIVLGLVLVLDLGAQEPRFADLLMGPNTSGAKARGCCVLRGDDIRGEGITIRQLIAAAYRRHAFDRRDVIGGPSWIDDERYDFTAKVAGGHVYDPSGFPSLTFATLRAYVDAKIAVRRERREQPVYALVSEQNARPGLVASTLDCAAQMRAMDRGEKIEGRPCGVSPYPGRLMAGGITMADLASLITPWVDRPVIDRTGLVGVFDVDVEGVEVKPPGPFGPSYRPSDTTASIFTTVQSQLGLRLEPVTAPIEVLIVERAEKPYWN